MPSVPTLHYADVVALNGRRMCRVCGDRPALSRYHYQFCGGRCRAKYRRLNDPDPDEILRRAEAIRATWSEQEREARRLHCNPNLVDFVLGRNLIPEVCGCLGH